MNIVHVVENLAIGGLEHMVISLSHWQRSCGHLVRIVCLFEAGALAATAQALGIEVVVLNKMRGFDLGAVLRMRSAVRTFRADVVHTHNAMTHYYAALACIGSGTGRLINTRHGMGPNNARARLNRLYRTSLMRTHAVVSVCEAVKSHFVQAGIVPPGKAYVIPNGVDIERLPARHPAARAALLSKLGVPSSQDVLIGIVGRLNAVKDHGTLIKAFASLRASGRQARLIVIGDGPTRSSLEALAKSLSVSRHVHCLGMRSDVERLLPALDIFALSSLSEGYSLALVEAAASALPIVATAVGGNADIVAEGSNGMLVPPSDPERLCEALAKLVDDPALRTSMGEAGRRWALEHGSIESMGAAYMALYAGEPVVAATRRGTAQVQSSHRPA